MTDARPYKVSASLTSEGGRLLGSLAEGLGAPKSVVIEMAVRQMAKRYRIDSDEEQARKA
ncbi:MAG TPA: hypothetical protein DCQ64_23850 [Candidatus Rokubacteria bacterium]|nr:hypothetical protein [Candidatus Rokubacteria bacterium]